MCPLEGPHTLYMAAAKCLCSCEPPPVGRNGARVPFLLQHAVICLSTAACTAADILKTSQSVHLMKSL
jgi:hypothetical protein